MGVIFYTMFIELINMVVCSLVIYFINSSAQQDIILMKINPNVFFVFKLKVSEMGITGTQIPR